jgi:RNA polymerase primary sigma factor
MSWREQEYLRLRFGFEGGNVHTAKEVADAFGLTQERVRQVEAKFAAHLRHPVSDPSPDAA